jgi:6-phosphofructokinase 2
MDIQGATPVIATLTMNPAIDLFVIVDQVIPGAKLRCRAPRRDPGGGGINVARVVTRLGGSARAAYPAGGSGGALLTRLLKQEGILAGPIEVEEPVRENLTVLEKKSGNQFRFVMPGTTLLPREQKQLLEAALDPPPAYLVASGSLPAGVPPGFYAELAGRARDMGVKLVLDTSGEALREGLKAGVFLVKPNRRELSQIAGRDLSGAEDQETVARGLVERGETQVAVASLGAGGVLLVTANGTERIPSPDVPVQSRVGAGDSLVGGIVLGLTRGMDIGTAVRFGVAAGAAAVMTPGTELCRQADTERLFLEMGGQT